MDWLVYGKKEKKSLGYGLFHINILKLVNVKLKVINLKIKSICIPVL